MPRDALDLLADVRTAVGLIEQFSTSPVVADYTVDALMRSAIERQFIIMGEALGQLDRLDPTLTARITDCTKIIAFRNILVHG